MSNRRIWRMLTVAAAMMWATASQAQNLALKTNLLYDATTTPNLGVEIGLGRRTTGQVFYGYNPWTLSGEGAQAKKAKHWVVMPEVRWWTCSKMNGFFYGIHAMGGQFNAANIDLPAPGAFFKGIDVFKTVRDNRLEGKFIGGGITAGYQWILSRHFNLEAEIGAGYDHVWYDKYPCSECSKKIEEGQTNYVGLTKLGLTLMYVF